MNDLSFITKKILWRIPFLPDLSICYVDLSTIFATWFVLIVLIAIIFICNIEIKNKRSMIRYIIMEICSYFMLLTKQSCGVFKYEHFSFVISLFFFILFCNLSGLTPFFEEPTADINTTLGLGIFAFLYTNYHAIKAHGVIGYVKEYFKPFFVLFPLNVIGKLASVVSLSCRLFGNMLGGLIINHLFLSLAATNIFVATACLASGLSIVIALFFGVFESFVQAFVFCMITITHLGIETAVAKENKHV